MKTSGISFPPPLLYVGYFLLGMLLGRLVIAKEERYLEASFGDEYQRYKAQVRRWI